MFTQDANVFLGVSKVGKQQASARFKNPQYLLHRLLSLIALGNIVQNLVPIAYMAGLSAICSLAVLPIFARRGEKVQLVFAVLQIAVLVLAASDILTAGR